MIETLEARIHADWQSLFPGEGVPESLRGFVLSTSRQPTGTRIIFFFGKGESGPRLVARIPRRPDRLEALEREWLRLGLLWNQAGEPLRQTLPRPLAAWKVQGLPVYLQQALPGASQKTLIQRGGAGWNAEALGDALDWVGTWLDGLQATPLPSVRGSLSVEAPAAEQLEAGQKCLIEQGIMNAQQWETLHRVALLLDEWPQTWVHGDLWPGNVLEQGGRRVVIDWDGLTLGPAWRDRCWYPIHLGMLVHAAQLGREDLVEGLRRVLCTDGVISRTVLTQLDRQLQPWKTAATTGEIVQVLLACEAIHCLQGQSTQRVLSLSAASLLRLWLSVPALFLPPTHSPPHFARTC